MRAGTELGFQNRSLWLAGWLVRWRMLGNLAPLAPLLARLQRVTARAGTDRSAMMVQAFGRAGGCRVERRWTLIANHGDGPEIPALSIGPLVDRILAGTEPPGARDAGECLSLAEYAPGFAGLAVAHATTEYDLPPSLYARVMGPRFHALPASVRAMHDVLRHGGCTGRAVVTGARTSLAALIARMIGFPRAGEHALHVSFASCDGRERWTRRFGTAPFRSHFSQHGPWLVERFGPLRFALDLVAEPGGLRMEMRRWWVGPCPLPLPLAPRVRAREWDEGGVFNFDVAIGLPLVGTIVTYRGWLSSPV